MKIENKAKDHRWLLLSLVVLGLAAALIVLPNQFRSEAGSKDKSGEGFIVRTSSLDEGIVKMYDIREDKGRSDDLLEIRTRAGKSAVEVADIRAKFAAAEEALKTQIPTAKVEYNTDIKIPEVITPDVWKSKISYLTSPSNQKRTDILRGFITQHNDLIGMTTNQINNLKVVADYTNPDGNLSYVHLEQLINNIPVFRGEIKAGFTHDNQIIRIINNLAPGLEYGSLATEFGDPLDAVKASAAHIKHELTPADVTRNSAASTDLKVVFGDGDWATTAEKMYFPTEPGIAVPAWRVLIWQPVNAYYVITDASTGKVLWHKNIADDQTQSVSYQVYANAPSLINTADHAAPLSPGPNDPGAGTQGVLGTRSLISLIGNEGDLSFNTNGWINDGANSTDGNATEAGIDRDGTNGVDAPHAGDSACPGAGCRVFTSTWNPPPGSPAPGDDPLTAQAQRGAVIQMFYIMNRYHDELYKRGFNEAARNFQNVNFTGMGVGNDRVSSEGQDSSGTNNANFATPADGGRGRMQMYIWTGPTPDRDGTPDADIVIHEVTHGTSNRLHGNGSGLGNQGGMMGEGWGDWYAHTMLAEPTDDPNGVYGLGGYSLLNLGAGFTANHYYGIRRFPTALIASTGGPNNRPHNPLTFGHINSNCDTTLGTTTTAVSSAYPRSPVIGTSGNCSQVHNAGEIWKSALWEVRSLMISRLGFAAGTTRVLQVVTDGMKLAPISPTFLQERDAIIAAASALPSAPEASADVVDVREGMRRRGMGFSASVQSNTAVTEAFDFPNVAMTNPFTVTDTPGNNNGVPEPGENVLLGVSIANTTGATVTGVVANINGGSNVSYGSINDGSTVTMQIPYTVDSKAACGSTVSVTINVSSDAGPQTPQIRSFVLGTPNGTVQNFDGVTAPTLPAGWASTITGAGTGWVTSTTGPSSAPNVAFAGDPAAVGISELETPAIAVNSPSAALKFKLNHVTENTFDGMVLEIKIGAGAYQDILAAGGSFTANGYNGTLSTGFSNPLPGRQAWTGNGGGYKNVEVALPAGANGQNVQFKFRMGSDSSVSATGVSVDDFSLVSSYTCSPVNPTISTTRADFDGDGKTDLSAFRPSEGNWYLNKSTAGFAVINWGLAADTLTPGDFDGDGKTDTAVFRPADAAGTPDFYVLNSNGFVVTGAEWGVTGDVPVIGDYDGDGKDDIAVFRPSDNVWYILNSGGGATFTSFGSSGVTPVPGDYDGDGKTDLATFNAGTWSAMLSGGGTSTETVGAAGDIPVPGDFDGDNKEDQATFRGSNGSWNIRLSSAGTVAVFPFGTSGDIPAPGDYDGDGKEDLAIYRAGQWWVLNSSSGSASVSSFGLGSDTPIVSKARP